MVWEHCCCRQEQYIIKSTDKKPTARCLKRKGLQPPPAPSSPLGIRVSKGRRGVCLSKASAQSPGTISPDMPKTDSIKSGDLGDNDSVLEWNPTAPSSRTATTKKTTMRRQRSVDSQSNRSSGKRKGKRKVKTRSRQRSAPKKEPEMELPDHQFEISVHRGPFEDLSSAEESLPVDTTEGLGTDSDEYDTDLETRFPSPVPSSLDTTGKTGYMKACKKLGVAPCSIFLRQCMDDKLRLRYYGLGPKEMRALAIGFRDNTFMTRVDLSYNRIGSEGVCSIAAALKENQHISHLDLTYCFLGRNENGAEAIWTLVHCSYHIHYLNVSRNCFTSNDYLWFTKILKESSRLYSLNISDNEFGSGPGLVPFLDALADSDILEELNMEWNPLTPLGVKPVLQSIARNMRLKHVNLAHTGVDDSTVPALLEVISCNDFLQSLDLRMHRLAPTKVQIISRAIHQYNSNIDLRLESAWAEGDR